VAFSIDDEYSKGLYDGLELVLSVIENREPELSPLNSEKSGHQH
jgi:hypothetical protein